MLLETEIEKAWYVLGIRKVPQVSQPWLTLH